MADTDFHDADVELSSNPSSDSDVDAESLFDVDSPTDGYFGQGSQQGPAHTPTASQATKAIEAAGRDSPPPEAQYNTLSSLSAFQPSTRWPDGADEATPMLDAGPAPPDYAAATAWRRSQQSDHDVDPDEDLYEDIGLLPMRDEGVDDASLVETLRWRKKVRRWWHPTLLLTSVIICGIVIAIAIFRFGKRSYDLKYQDYWFPDHPLSNIGHPERYHKSTKECPFSSYSPYYWTTIEEARSFSFLEEINTGDEPDFENGLVSGEIEIRPAPYGQVWAIEAYTNFALTKPWFVKDTLRDIDSSKTRSVVRMPHLGKRRLDLRSDEALPRPCLNVWIGIYVRGVELDDWETHTKSLHIDVGYPRSLDKGRRKEWVLKVKNETRISTINGNITVSYWDSKNIKVTSTGGSISGQLALHERLTLETQRGVIDTAVRHWLPYVNNGTYARDSDTPAILSTKNGIGDTRFRLSLGPAINGSHAEYLVNSHHQSDSGSLAIDYGPDWEGKIHTRTSDGFLAMDGDEVELLRGSNSHHIEALRRTGNSSMTAETGTGNATLQFSRWDE